MGYLKKREKKKKKKRLNCWVYCEWYLGYCISAIAKTYVVNSMRCVQVFQKWSQVFGTSECLLRKSPSNSTGGSMPDRLV